MGGDTFLVKKEDIELAPHLFQATEGSVGVVHGPEVEIKPLEAPQSLTAEVKRKPGRPKKE
jgi:hypothetical protein